MKAINQTERIYFGRCYKYIRHQYRSARQLQKYENNSETMIIR
jgi:hypothetical protein